MKFELGKNDPRLGKWVEKVQQRLPKVMRMFANEAYRQVFITTPVLLGRARWGWNCSIGVEDLTVPPPGRYSADPNRAERVFTMTALKQSDADSLYICNAVPYIGYLNEGSSKKAPARFVELSFSNAVNKVKILVNGQS